MSRYLYSKLFSPEEEEKLCELYLSGESTLTLAERLQVSKATIYRILARRGVIRNLSEARKVAFQRKRLNVEDWVSVTLKKGWGWNRGKPHSKETKRKMSRIRRERMWPSKPSVLTKEEEEEVCRLYSEGWTRLAISHRFNCSGSTVQRILTKHRVKRSAEEKRRIAVTKINRINSDPEIIKNRLKALMKRPTKPEKKLIKIIEKFNLPFIYSGDGKVIINRLCPDFISVDGTKRIIEVFGKYWHRKNTTYHRTEKGRKEVFSKFGFRTLIIWEDELDDEENILKRIREF